MEEAKTAETIRAIYEDIYPNIHPSHRWLFAASVDEKLAELRATQIAWIDGVRRLYPQQYEDIKLLLERQIFEKITWNTPSHKGGFHAAVKLWP